MRRRPRSARFIPLRIRFLALACGYGLGAAGLVALSPAETARADVVERVVAVVNDEAIFLSDLRRRAVPFLPQVMSSGSEGDRVSRLSQLYGQLLTMLIDEELFQQAADKMSISVSSDDVDRAIDNVRQQNGLNEEEFWQAVAEQGLSEGQYRTDVRKQLLRLKIVNERVRGRVNITEDDIRRKYEESLRSANRQQRFRASHVVFPFSEGASATELAQVRTQAKKVRDQLSVDNFPEAIEQYEGGDLGWLRQGDLPEALENALLALRAGEISEPIRGTAGYHVFLLHEQEQGGSNMPPYSEAKQRIQREMLDSAMRKQERAFIEELRRDAMITRRIGNESKN